VSQRQGRSVPTKAGALDRIPLALPVVLAVAVFVRAASFRFVQWDDGVHLLGNPLTQHPLARGWVGLFWSREMGYPAPLVVLSYCLDRALFGIHPAPYHLENVALHCANVALLFRVARRMRLTPWEACGAACLFAVHPLVVEPVCWVIGRKDLLAVAMLLVAVLVAAGRADRDEPGPAWRWLVAGVLSFLCVLSLPRMVLASVLATILVCAIRPEWRRRDVALRLAPAVLPALAVVALGAREVADLGVPHRTASDVLADVAGAWALQLAHLVFPVDLLSYYFRVPGDPSVLAMSVAAVVAVAAVVLVLARTEPGSPMRVGAVLALVAYAPASCVFGTNRWTSDSYMYFPLAALALAAAPAVMRVWPTRLAGFGRVAAASYVAILALLSVVASLRWTSPSTVWTGSIARYPDQPLAYEHEAIGLLDDGRADEASGIFIQIAERFPEWKDTLDDEVRAYLTRGDASRAEEVLARGVRAGNPECLRMYWLRLIESRTLPGPEQRDLVAVAFDGGAEQMAAGLHDPVSLDRVAAILESEKLDAMAARARELAAAARAGGR
jgi:hypothetical protein